MEIRNLAAGAEAFTSNAFLVDSVALVDVGAAPVVLERLGDAAVETVAITHSHHDHVEHLEAVVDRCDPAVYAFAPDNLPVPATPLADGDTVDLAGYAFEVLHTPGHRDDHVCLFHAESGTLFAGDLIFPGGSFGRTDLEQGDRDTLIASIERVADRDVRVMYSGHDDPTTDDVNAQIRESLRNARKREPKYD